MIGQLSNPWWVFVLLGIGAGIPSNCSKSGFIAEAWYGSYVSQKSPGLAWRQESQQTFPPVFYVL